MNGEQRQALVMVIVLILAVMTVALTLIGWGINSSHNDHDFDVTCLKSGKTIQYTNLEGTSSVYKECK